MTATVGELLNRIRFIHVVWVGVPILALALDLSAHVHTHTWWEITALCISVALAFLGIGLLWLARARKMTVQETFDWLLVLFGTVTSLVASLWSLLRH